MQDVIRIPRGSRSWHFVFGAQPLAQPPARVSFHRPVGLADRTETKVVGPADDFPVELRHQYLYRLLSLTTSGRLTNRLTDALYASFRRSGAQIGAPRLRRIAAPKRITQEVELLFRQRADPCLGLVHRQLESGHHVPHGDEGLLRSAPAADHEIIGVVDDTCFQALLVSQL